MTDRDLVRVARALADPTRVRILRSVAADGNPCCGAITRDVPVRPATVSHHLRILADAGLVETERAGQFIHVRVRPDRLAELQEALGRIVGGTSAGSSRTRRPRSRRVA
jgi:ArsR family transcriptional regulator